MTAKIKKTTNNMITQTTTNTADPNVVKESKTAPDVNYSGYCQIVPMTFDEKVKMYMRCTKLELARMLAERDRLGLDYVPYPQPQPYIPPYQPWGPPPVWYEWPHITCEQDVDPEGYSTSVSTADYSDWKT